MIVNADDFGASDEVNEAVIRAHRDGVLTSTSLMVTGAAAQQAVTLAKENPRLAVGIHLVTVMGRSALPPSEIPSLVDQSGNFPNGPVAAGVRYFFSPRARRELRKELRAQFEMFKSTGLPLSHIDGHLHLHVHPVIFRAAMELGIEYGARRMRVPADNRQHALGFDPGHRFQKTVLSLLFEALARYMRPKLRRNGFAFPERVYGNLQSGRMNCDYFLYALERLDAATSEIYFHPALYQNGQVLTSEQTQCQREFLALTSREVTDTIRRLGISLTNYFELEVAS